MQIPNLQLPTDLASPRPLPTSPSYAQHHVHTPRPQYRAGLRKLFGPSAADEQARAARSQRQKNRRRLRASYNVLVQELRCVRERWMQLRNDVYAMRDSTARTELEMERDGTQEWWAVVGEQLKLKTMVLEIEMRYEEAYARKLRGRLGRIAMLHTVVTNESMQVSGAHAEDVRSAYAVAAAPGDAADVPSAGRAPPRSPRGAERAGSRAALVVGERALRPAGSAHYCPGAAPRLGAA